MGKCLGKIRTKIERTEENDLVDDESTRLVDLPNELMMMIAKELDDDDRRRLSQTCRRMFFFIKHWRGSILRNVKVMYIRDFGRFILMAFQNKDSTHVRRRIVVYAHNVSRPRLMSIPDSEIVWVQTVENETRHVRAMSLLVDSREYFTAQAMCYTAAKFELNVINALLQMHPHCSFVTTSYGKAAESEFLITKILQLFLINVDEATEDQERNDLKCRHLHVEESIETTIKVFPASEFRFSTERLFKTLASIVEGRKVEGKLSFSAGKPLQRTLRIELREPTNDTFSFDLQDET